jgi:hypothetical protein
MLLRFKVALSYTLSECYDARVGGRTPSGARADAEASRIASCWRSMEERLLDYGVSAVQAAPGLDARERAPLLPGAERAPDAR